MSTIEDDTTEVSEIHQAPVRSKKKKFIDKKHATTFVLTNRSQRDPLIADETAPQNILLPLDQVPSAGGGGGGPSKHKKYDKETLAKRKEEQLKYGIYFDDEYDYLQHLKDSTEVSNIEWDYAERIYAPQQPPTIENGHSTATNTTKGDLKDIRLKLPSSVFESEFREDIGLLNKAAVSRGPRPDLDPDIIAALDDDFDFTNPDNELEDDFFSIANQEPSLVGGESSDLQEFSSIDEERYEGQYSSNDDYDYEDEEADSVGSLKKFALSEDENQSRFTSYSMSSSVIQRNKQLLLVDDCFEKMFEGYDDTEIGPLDCDAVEGDMSPDSDLLLKYAEEFQQEQKKDEFVNEKIKNLALQEEESGDDDSDSDEGDAKREKWDCESILSTYSNKRNLPKVISESSKRNIIKVSGGTGIPAGVFGKGLTKHSLKALDEKYATGNNAPTRVGASSVLSGATSIRNKEETPEERKERKKLVKDYRRERRLERKANTDAFKEEKKKLEKSRLNDKHNIPTLKL